MLLDRPLNNPVHYAEAGQRSDVLLGLCGNRHGRCNTSSDKNAARPADSGEIH
jgi:hypothetical protein